MDGHHSVVATDFSRDDTSPKGMLSHLFNDFRHVLPVFTHDESPQWSSAMFSVDRLQ